MSETATFTLPAQVRGTTWQTLPDLRWYAEYVRMPPAGEPMPGDG
jgi:hypothetical protein